MTYKTNLDQKDKQERTEENDDCTANTSRE